jgi:hypothetical protein
MSDYKIEDYTFLGLCKNGKPMELVDSLVYMVALADSEDHQILDLSVANQVLGVVFDMDELITQASDMATSQELSLPTGYYPQTPAMVTRAWSPIASMLERSFKPIALKRDPTFLSVATGIWSPTLFEKSEQVAGLFENVKQISDAETSEELFWSILPEAFSRAMKRGKFVSVVAKPGWSYESSIGSLAEWTIKEIALADKILWKRTPEG